MYDNDNDNDNEDEDKDKDDEDDDLGIRVREDLSPFRFTTLTILKIKLVFRAEGHHH